MRQLMAYLLAYGLQQVLALRHFEAAVLQGAQAEDREAVYRQLAIDAARTSERLVEEEVCRHAILAGELVGDALEMQPLGGIARLGDATSDRMDDRLRIGSDGMRHWFVAEIAQSGGGSVHG
jgi:hypothetical protein